MQPRPPTTSATRSSQRGRDSPTARRRPPAASSAHASSCDTSLRPSASRARASSSVRRSNLRKGLACAPPSKRTLTAPAPTRRTRRSGSSSRPGATGICIVGENGAAERPASRCSMQPSARRPRERCARGAGMRSGRHAMPSGSHRRRCERRQRRRPAHRAARAPRRARRSARRPTRGRSRRRGATRRQYAARAAEAAGPRRRLAVERRPGPQGGDGRRGRTGSCRVRAEDDARRHERRRPASAGGAQHARHVERAWPASTSVMSAIRSRSPSRFPASRAHQLRARADRDDRDRAERCARYHAGGRGAA